MGMKAKLESIAKKNLKIVKSKNYKGIIEHTLDNAVVERLDKIISEESVSGTSTSASYVENRASLADITALLKISARNKVNRPCVVFTIPMKEASEFSFIQNDSLGQIIRGSTFPSTYKEIRDKWVALNKVDKDDPSNIPNVLYFPELCMFLDGAFGYKIDKPFKFDALIVSVPSTKTLLENMQGDDDRSEEEFIANTVVEYVLTAIIKCGIKNPIVSPFDLKYMHKHPYETAKAWYEGIQLKKPIDNINKIIFAVKDDYLFATLTAYLFSFTTNFDTTGLVNDAINVIKDTVGHKLTKKDLSYKLDNLEEELEEITEDDPDISLSTF